MRAFALVAVLVACGGSKTVEKPAPPKSCGEAILDAAGHPPTDRLTYALVTVQTGDTVEANEWNAARTAMTQNTAVRAAAHGGRVTEVDTGKRVATSDLWLAQRKAREAGVTAAAWLRDKGALQPEVLLACRHQSWIKDAANLVVLDGTGRIRDRLEASKLHVMCLLALERCVDARQAFVERTESLDGRPSDKELAAAKQNKVVTGATPPDLVTTVAIPNDTLSAGGSTTITLTVENRGESTAVDVVARTRSRVGGLDKRVVSFGKIQPKSTVSRTITAQLPFDTAPDGPSDPTVTIVLEVDERGGHKAPDQTLRPKLLPALCAGKGTLTTAQFDAKRAGLQKLVDDKTLSNEDYRQYIALLTSCL